MKDEQNLLRSSFILSQGELIVATTVQHEEEKSISCPPTSWDKFKDRGFRVLTKGACWFTLLLGGYILWTIIYQAGPAIGERGVSFLVEETWDANSNTYGILPQIWGTLYSSVLGLLVGSIFGIAIAIFLSEGLLGGFLFKILKVFGVQFHPFWGKLPDRVENILKITVDLLAAIPSVVYGLWGIFVVMPLIRPMCAWLDSHLGWIPLFQGTLGTGGMLPAALVLGIMVLPTISAISRDALVAVPPRIREAAYGLGATRWETITGVLLPTAGPGILGGVLLAFGRALGETMALAMLVGNANRISLSLFAPGNTLAALLANNFSEANLLTVPVLMYAALVLLLITLLVNILGNLILMRAQRGLVVQR
jgi:phosphate transport system permease protein